MIAVFAFQFEEYYISILQHNCNQIIAKSMKDTLIKEIILSYGKKFYNSRKVAAVV